MSCGSVKGEMVFSSCWRRFRKDSVIELSLSGMDGTFVDRGIEEFPFFKFALINKIYMKGEHFGI
jgi:hypothetical protein